MRNTKGMSEVVTTVIFVSLALIAIGIVWVVINGLIQKGASDVTSSSDCLKIDVTPTAASCVGTICSVTLNRKAGGPEIAGVKIVFKDASGNSGTVITESAEPNLDYLEPLATKVLTDLTSGTDSLPTKVEVSAYVLDAEGAESICTQVRSFNVASEPECAVATQAVDCDDGVPTTTDTCNTEGLCVNTAA